MGTVIELGDRVKDPLTGVVGIAYCRMSYLQGCDRIGIQQDVIKRKEDVPLIPDLWNVDEPQLVVVKKGVIECQDSAKISVKKKAAKASPGGPSFSSKDTKGK